MQVGYESANMSLVTPILVKLLKTFVEVRANCRVVTAI